MREGRGNTSRARKGTGACFTPITTGSGTLLDGNKPKLRSKYSHDRHFLLSSSCFQSSSFLFSSLGPTIDRRIRSALEKRVLILYRQQRVRLRPFPPSLPPSRLRCCARPRNNCNETPREPSPRSDSRRQPALRCRAPPRELPPAAGAGGARRGGHEAGDGVAAGAVGHQPGRVSQQHDCGRRQAGHAQPRRGHLRVRVRRHG